MALTLLTARLLIAGLVVAGGGLLFYLRYSRDRTGRNTESAGANDVTRLFPAIMVAGLLCRLVFAFLTPGFHGPDEYPHYKYIQYLAKNHTFPVEKHMWGDSSYDWEFCQPPLYYAAMVPVYLAAARVFHSMTVTVYALRLASVLLWVGTVWVGVLLLRRLKIMDPLIKSFVLGVVCLLPTYTFVSAMINNDNMLTLLGGGLLCIMAGGTFSLRRSLALGILLGAALLTKQSAVIFIPALVTLYALEAAGGRMKWSSAGVHLGVVFASGLAFFLPWALRNYYVYGSFTPEFLFVQTRTWSNPLVGLLAAGHNVLKSFWSVSGPGNEVGYPFPLVGIVFLFLCLNWRKETAEEPEMATAEPARDGFSVPAVVEAKPDFVNRAINRPFFAACLLAFVVNLLLVLRFGYVLGMGQGRHLFPVLLPIAVFLAARWRTFPVKQLEPYTAALWIAYAFSFLLFSMWLLPVVPR